MDYEKEYKEALERMKDIVIVPKNERQLQLIKETVFPELGENKNEDEVIRKWLIDWAKTVNWSKQFTITKEEVLTWLEKQGEQKPINDVESNFKIEKGKWYVCIKDLLDNYANKAFREGDIYLSTQDGSLIPSNSNIPYEITCCPDTYFREWTIQDAKDGDVLCYEAGNELRIFIYKNGHTHYHCCYYNGNLTTVDSFFVIQKHLLSYIHPATKEQRDILFAKMKEAGYIFDFEKKELKKISQEYPLTPDECIESVWSKEDEKMLNGIIAEIEANRSDAPSYDIPVYESFLKWLNSLKQRLGGE